jgi:hypothetical protein
VYFDFFRFDKSKQSPQQASERAQSIPLQESKTRLSIAFLSWSAKLMSFTNDDNQRSERVNKQLDMGQTFRAGRAQTAGTSRAQIKDRYGI